MNLKIDRTWSLFLDRDGVINERLPDAYVKSWDQFRFAEGVLEALETFFPEFLQNYSGYQPAGNRQRINDRI
jgi:histidinol phosphatase-like enzyme